MIVVPKCSDVKISCIVCKNTIEANKNYINEAVNVGVWDNATVATAFSSYTSKLGSCGFIIGICDCCLKQAVDDAHAIKFYDHLDATCDIKSSPGEKQYLEFELEIAEDNVE